MKALKIAMHIEELNMKQIPENGKTTNLQFSITGKKEKH